MHFGSFGMFDWSMEMVEDGGKKVVVQSGVDWKISHLNGGVVLEP